MKTGASVLQDNMLELKRSLAELVKKRVVVGVTGDTTGREDNPHLTNSELAYIHTFGGTIQVPAHQAAIYRLIDKEGGFLRGGRFVRRDVSNFETSHVVPAHSINIPPRPFLEEGIRDNQEEINKYLGRAAKAALSGDMEGIENNLHAAGLSGQNGARNKILTGPFIPLSPSTIKNRLSRGHTRTNPLNDTGGLHNSITYALRDK